MTPLGTAALALAAKGLRVFPCWERTKDPFITGWEERATTDANFIRGWWRRYDLNIAIATGPGSGIWVLDLDGAEDEAWLRPLEQEHGTLPPTVEAISGRGDGGRHLYFRWPKDKDKKIHNLQDRDDFPDVRGKGGYIMAPPSIHPSGRRYAWSVNSGRKFAAAPDWLIDLVTNNKNNKSRNGGASITAATPESWRSFINDDVDGSRRGHVIARLYGLLVRRDPIRCAVDPIVALDIVRMFNALHCKPPFEDGEVVRIANDIARREASRRTEANHG
jgi:hypothetical protein